MSTRTTDRADPVGTESTRWSANPPPGRIDRRSGRAPASRHYAAVIAGEVLRLRRELRTDTELERGAHARWAAVARSEQRADLDVTEAQERAA
jgi:hypothetical protein